MLSCKDITKIFVILQRYYTVTDSIPHTVHHHPSNVCDYFKLLIS